MTAFLGITREAVFSPGRIDDDSAILHLVAAHLRRQGHDVRVVAADDAQWPEVGGNAVVFAMCQGPRALERLRGWQARGIRIVNRPDAILDCQRHRTIAAFARAGIAFPESVVVDTTSWSRLPPWVVDGVWIKRGDVHATEPDDVVFVDGSGGAAGGVADTLRRFGERSIERVVVQRHVPGEVVKFYAVRDRFFHCVRRPGSAHLPAALRQQIDALGRAAARALNVEVYGGDCIVGANGELRLIDLNDWPSYAPCRSEAAEEIAAYLVAGRTQQPFSGAAAQWRDSNEET
jgi:hypothetical protein